MTRTVLVSGASGGVGEGIARSCGAAGWDVWIAARRRTEGEAVAHRVDEAGGSGHFVRCDIGDPDAVAAAIEMVAAESGVLHGVVHNATSGLSSHPGDMGELTADELEDHARVSVRGLFLLATAARPLLANSGGAIVVTTSEAGFEGKARLAAYASVKASQRGLARVLAREWGPDGIRVNCVAPLSTSPALTEAFDRDPSMSDRVRSRIPLGRVGDPVDDIGPVVRFLLSDDARFLTSQTLMVDGGSCAIS
jgi:3-oxoacyl-[acyl-carrier protein] reductase